MTSANPNHEEKVGAVRQRYGQIAAGEISGCGCGVGAGCETAVATGIGYDAAELGGPDCDDADPLRHPGLLEICDAADHDEDCDDATFGERDLDRDGAFDARCCNEDGAGVRTCGDDCDDARRGVRPLGAEVCDGLDQDCDLATVSYTHLTLPTNREV